MAVLDTPPHTAAEFTPVQFHAFGGDFHEAVATAKVVLAGDVGKRTCPAVAAHAWLCRGGSTWVALGRSG